MAASINIKNNPNKPLRLSIRSTPYGNAAKTTAPGNICNACKYGIGNTRCPSEIVKYCSNYLSQDEIFPLDIND